MIVSLSTYVYCIHLLSSAPINKIKLIFFETKVEILIKLIYLIIIIN